MIPFRHVPVSPALQVFAALVAPLLGASLQLPTAHAGFGPPCSCLGDITNDNVVDGADLGALLADWGENGPGDFDDNGIVDGADLGLLLAVWGPCPPPVNDACGGALPIGNSGFYDFCTLNATSDGPSVSGLCGPFTPTIDKDVWFSYEAAGSGTLGLSTCEGASFDTIIAIYESIVPGASACPPANGEVGLSTLIACNDDDPTCTGHTSRVEAEVVQGHRYMIRVGGFSQAAGEGVLDVDFTSVGNDCDDSIIVTGEPGETIVVTGITTDNAHVSPPCVFGSAGGEWITYIPPCAAAHVTVSTCHPGTDFDTAVTVWRQTTAGGCPGTWEVCVDDTDEAACLLNGFFRKSKLEFECVPGSIYHIMVSGFSGSEGAYELTIQADCP